MPSTSLLARMQVDMCSDPAPVPNVLTTMDGKDAVVGSVLTALGTIWLPSLHIGEAASVLWNHAHVLPRLRHGYAEGLVAEAGILAPGLQAPCNCQEVCSHWGVL